MTSGHRKGPRDTRRDGALVPISGIEHTTLRIPSPAKAPTPRKKFHSISVDATDDEGSGPCSSQMRDAWQQKASQVTIPDDAPFSQGLASSLLEDSDSHEWFIPVDKDDVVIDREEDDVEQEREETAISELLATSKKVPEPPGPPEVTMESFILKNSCESLDLLEKVVIAVYFL